MARQKIADDALDNPFLRITKKNLYHQARHSLEIEEGFLL